MLKAECRQIYDYNLLKDKQIHGKSVGVKQPVNYVAFTLMTCLISPSGAEICFLHFQKIEVST